MLELYHWEPNGSWLKPLIALYEKELPFRSRYVDVLALEQYQPGFLQAARETQIPLEGEGPVLIDQGRQITESLFITEYLEDAYPARPLRPPEPLLQARILASGRFINEVLMPAVSTLGCRAYLVPALQGGARTALATHLERMPVAYIREGWRSALNNDYPAELLEDSRRKITLAVTRLEEALGGGPWLVGASFTLADVDAFAICNSLPGLTPDLVNAAATPRLWHWLKRIRSRPAVGRALACGRGGHPEQAFAPGPEHSRWG
ncbi:MAG TPA: glutathione S-transferase family protein [Steroidobacteraceae bacterium]|nr:glutathione S-transferase family protein [Steroidobacteraceae bacterium]